MTTKVKQSLIDDILATGTTTARSLADRFGDVGNINDFMSLQDAVNYAYANGSAIFLPSGVYSRPESIPSFHEVAYFGAGAIQAGDKLFYPFSKRDHINNLYVSPSGDDTNDGLSADAPFETIQRALDVWSMYSVSAHGPWVINLSTGIFTEGGYASGVNAQSELTISGESKALTVIDGTTASSVMGLNFNSCTPVRVKNLTVQNWGGVGSGIIFQNGTRGVVDTCDAIANAEANFNCSEDSEMVFIGACSSSGATKFGMRYYRNSGGSVGDGTNPITISDATQAGIVSRDGSKVVTRDGLVISDCVATGTTAGVLIQKDGYVELRTCTISGNSIGVFCENNSIVDTQTGVRNVSGNAQDYRITQNSVDRSLFSTSSNITQHWKVQSNPSGLGPSSNYDLVVDYNGVTGLQFLSAGSAINIDFNKTERINVDPSGHTATMVINSASAYRWQAGSYIPMTDNTKSNGAASFRWSVIYAGTGTINTSDERLKTDLVDIDEAEIACAREVKSAIKKYKMLDSVSVKGEEKARWHFGVGAQTVIDIFRKHGLDPFSYGLVCYDKWDYQPAEYDEDGGEISPEIQAGDRYGIRYDELAMFIIAAI